MELFITKNIGRRKYTFTVAGTTLHEVVMESEHLSFDDVNFCGLCGSDNLALTARVAQNKYKYVSIKCANCRADLTFGKTQEDDQTYFLRRRADGQLDWKEYVKEPQA